MDHMECSEPQGRDTQRYSAGILTVAAPRQRTKGKAKTNRDLRRPFRHRQLKIQNFQFFQSPNSRDTQIHAEARRDATTPNAQPFTAQRNGIGRR